MAGRRLNHFATNRPADWPFRRFSRAPGVRPLVADLVAETAVGGHFVAIPLGSSELPFAPLGALLGPKPKGEFSVERGTFEGF